jgi:hypothetical protein
MGVDGEVVVADNGSADESAIQAELAGARVVRVARRGYGSAIRGGVEAARSEFVIIADADGQHDYEELPRFFEQLRAGYELVVGNRFAGKMQREAMSWTHRYIGNPLLSGLLRLLFHPQVRDAQSGMRGVTRSAFFAMDLRTSGFEFSPEMVVKATHHHLRVTEVPISVRPDQRNRKPHLRTVPDGWRHLVFILMCSPNVVFVLPGALMLALGIAVVTWLAAGPQYLGAVGLDTRAQLFGALLACLGAEVASVGVFARVFSYSEPMRTSRASATRFFSGLSLEKGLLAGGALIGIGAVGDATHIVPWAVAGFAILRDVRWVIFWSVWVMLGFQICVSSVFLSMIGISRGVWLGNGSATRRAADRNPPAGGSGLGLVDHDTNALFRARSVELVAQVGVAGDDDKMGH